METGLKHPMSTKRVWAFCFLEILKRTWHYCKIIDLKGKKIQKKLIVCPRSIDNVF